MTVDTQKLGLEACRRWAEVAGLSDDDWRSRAAFVSGYEVGHREALEQGIVQEMVAALEAVEWSGPVAFGAATCPACGAGYEGGRHWPDCQLMSALAHIRGEGFGV